MARAAKLSAWTAGCVFLAGTFVPHELSAQQPSKQQSVAKDNDTSTPGQSGAGQSGAGRSSARPSDAGSRRSVLRFAPLTRRSLVTHRYGSGRAVDSDFRVIHHHLGASIGAPIVRGRTIVAATGTYAWDRLRGGTDQSAVQSLDLHRFSLGFPIITQVSETWTLSFGARMIYASDLEQSDRAAWRPLMRAGATWQFRENSAFMFGLVLARLNVGYVPLPTLGFFYRPEGRRVQFDMLLPRITEVRVVLSPRWELFSGIRFQILNWRVQEQAFFQFAEVRAETGARAALFGPVELELAAGSTVWRRFTLTPDGEEMEQNILGKPGIAITARLNLRTN